jgi:hypothetical protein
LARVDLDEVEIVAPRRKVSSSACTRCSTNSHDITRTRLAREAALFCRAHPSRSRGRPGRQFGNGETILDLCSHVALSGDLPPEGRGSVGQKTASEARQTSEG